MADPGRAGILGRFALWILLVATAGAYVLVHLWPAITRRINPLFAAATIENSKPSLKNSLINFLLLRGQRDAVALPVYQAIEQARQPI